MFIPLPGELHCLHASLIPVWHHAGPLCMGEFCSMPMGWGWLVYLQYCHLDPPQWKLMATGKKIKNRSWMRLHVCHLSAWERSWGTAIRNDASFPQEKTKCFIEVKHAAFCRAALAAPTKPVKWPPIQMDPLASHLKWDCLFRHIMASNIHNMPPRCLWQREAWLIFIPTLLLLSYQF